MGAICGFEAGCGARIDGDGESAVWQARIGINSLKRADGGGEKSVFFGGCRDRWLKACGLEREGERRRAGGRHGRCPGEGSRQGAAGRDR
jgi:hypothetical protein